MVYVDDFCVPVGRMLLCHLFATSTEELLQMADKLGIAHKYMKWPGTPSECFEITMTKKRAAIAAGAGKTTFAQYCKMSDIKKRNTKRQEQGKPLFRLKINYKKPN